MRLGLTVGYSGAGMALPMEMIKEAENLGFDSCWTAEAYGSDAVTPLAWIGAQTERIKLGTAIMQVPGRQPAMTAMTAMTLDALSGGRFVLGLGPSGPQVVEGWYGVGYKKPLTRMREYITVLREIFAREKRVEFNGEFYQMPYTGPGSVGLGKPLRSILHARPDMKIYTAAISPNGVKLAAELADGFFPIWCDPQRFELFQEPIDEGFKKSGKQKTMADFDVAPFVSVILGPDADKCRSMVKPMMALYIGGMGARGKNFYNDFAKRLGYEEEAVKIQDLYLDGKKQEAAALVPDELVDAVSFCGPEERIRDLFDRWRGAPVGTLCIGTNSKEALRLMAELVL